ncbi:MAG TPA: nuclear transport factor 2 family protein [Propionibacteriaceae bacterium]|nr:nuclear transport factor 2 family protein [Propionibacteriaceae bacterium]
MREVVEQFWTAMQRNDWSAAAAYFVAEIEIDWPCSGERIVGRANFVALQERYPTTTGRWMFDIHRLVTEGPTTVSEVTVTDGVQSARVIAFSDVADGLIARHVEYWPTAYEPPADRADLVERIPPVP